MSHKIHILNTVSRISYYELAGSTVCWCIMNPKWLMSVNGAFQLKSIHPPVKNNSISNCILLYGQLVVYKRVHGFQLERPDQHYFFTLFIHRTLFARYKPVGRLVDRHVCTRYISWFIGRCLLSMPGLRVSSNVLLMKHYVAMTTVNEQKRLTTTCESFC